MARGATTQKIKLLTGSMDEVTAAIAESFKATPEGLPMVLSIGGGTYTSNLPLFVMYTHGSDRLLVVTAPLQAKAWDALNTLLDDNKSVVSPTGEVVRLPEGTQVIFLAESRLHEPVTAASVSRISIFQMSEPMTELKVHT